MLNKTAKDFLAVLIFLAVFILFIIFGVFYFTLETDEIDESSGCEKSGPDAYSVIVVDNTNKLNYIQQEAIKNRIYDIIFTALPNEKIIIYSLGNNVKDNSDIEKINPIVEKCPYKDGSKANKLIANPEMMKREKEKRFDAPIKKALESIIKREKGSNFSPILELITKIKVTVLHEVTSKNKKEASSEKKPIEIHLFSDLLQNSNNFSFYKKQNLDVFLKGNKFNNVNTNLEGIDFIIWQLNNSMIPISKILFDFEKILRKMKVGSVERKNIEG